ncbi:translocase of chloroplast 159, chloroplastic [Ziziphus jujuba]|uniref:Translocase of chloroplast 159, chloroplastic n=1 Tax=Ziziphus jujuba TaxID=326968 RepID=A0A6P6GFU2_ZIZJJ|nr:translocase of chloroplast 159, chloroplastic [Ziziphus jujuba]
MDGDSGPEVTPHLSSSPGSNSVSNPSQSSNNVETHVFNVDNVENTSGVGGFIDVSGEKEDFEPPLEKPILGGEDVNAPYIGYSEFWKLNSRTTPNADVSVDVGDDVGGSRDGVLGVEEVDKVPVGGFGAEKSEVLGTGSEVVLEEEKEVLLEAESAITPGLTKRPSLRELLKETSVSDGQEEGVVEVSRVVGEEDKVLGGSKLDDGAGSVVEGSLVVEELEGTDLKDEKVVVEQEIEASIGRQWGVSNDEKEAEVVGESKILTGGNYEDNYVAPEPTENKLVEAEGVTFTTGGDSVVEPVDVNLSESGAAVVGDFKEIEESQIRGVEVPIDRGVNLDNGLDKISEESAYKSLPMEPELKVDSEAEKNGLMTEISAGGAEHDAKPIENVDTCVNSQVNELETGATLNHEIRRKAEDVDKHLPDEEDGIHGSVTDEETEGVVFGSSEAAQQFLEELEQGSGTGSHSGAESSRDYSQRIDGQIVTDSDEEVDTDEEGGGKELFDSAALAALLKAATGASSDSGNITITASDGSRLFSVERPAGLGSSLRSVKPASRPNQSSLFAPSNLPGEGDSDNNLSEEEKKKLEKFQQMRVKYLRLIERLGLTTDESIARQVLYRLALVSGRQTSQVFSLDTAKRTALQLEAEGKDDINFSLNILVLGKTGVGKSATINSIFGEEKTPIYAFGPATTTVKEIVGLVDGVKIRVFDTPGLRSAAMEQMVNRKILSSVKKVTRKCPPDIVLYVDRLDTQSRDLNDLPLLRSITSALGPAIWRSAIVTLTHAASSPPDGPSGSPLNYELFVAQRSQIVQQAIGQAVGDLRIMNPSLMNPISLVENHPSCRKNRDGQKVLPNGQTWRSQLLLLCYSMKILSEASNFSKPQDSFDHKKLFGFRVRSPPLPYLLSWLLQSRTHPKLSADQGGDNGDSDIDLADLSESDDDEEEDEYDQLPSFKPLRNSQLAKLSKEQRKAYFEEYDYRVKLLQKKQWREELKRMKEMKKKGKVSLDEYGYMGEDDPESGSPAAVPVALPDMALPPSFDGDNPAYRYRFLEPTSQFLARPVLDTHGWDHDCGYDGVNVEQTLAVASRFPAAVTVQITKDKKEFNIHLDSSVAAKYGENGSAMAGFDIQNIGKQLAYIVRGETKFKNLKKNKTTAGVSVTFLGENVSTGVKVEDQITLGKRLVLVGSTGTVRSQGDAAYGANLEVRLREADFPIGQDQSSLGLSLVKWRGDLALGANFQSQFSVGRNYKVGIRAGLNNKLSGQISVRTSSSDQLQIALVAILPIVKAIYKSIQPGVSDNYSLY